MRTHLSRLVLAALAALALACGPTGPNTYPGLSPCDQLRECACDPDQSFDPAACNQMVDMLEASSNPDIACRQRFASFGCGQPLQVNQAGF